MKNSYLFFFYVLLISSGIYAMDGLPDSAQFEALIATMKAQDYRPVDEIAKDKLWTRTNNNGNATDQLYKSSVVNSLSVQDDASRQDNQSNSCVTTQPYKSTVLKNVVKEQVGHSGDDYSNNADDNNPDNDSNEPILTSYNYTGSWPKRIIKKCQQHPYIVIAGTAGVVLAVRWFYQRWHRKKK